jgi:AmmeMemoRadiSam system protein A
LTHESISEAGICGLGPLWLLLGAFEGHAYKTHRLSYEGPFGVGYTVASFEETHGTGHFRAKTVASRLLLQIEAVRKTMSPIAAYALRVLEARLNSVVPPRIEIGENAYSINGKIFEIDKVLRQHLLSEAADVFVSIKSNGALRGCIGSVGSEDVASLYEKVAYYVGQAASRDTRFEPVEKAEFEMLTVSVDVLSPLEVVKSQSLLDHKRYGICVSDGVNSGVLLPDIEGVDSVVEQMRIAANKGGFAVEEIKRIYRFSVDRYC